MNEEEASIYLHGLAHGSEIAHPELAHLRAVADAARVLAPILETVGTSGEGTGNFWRRFDPAKEALAAALDALDGSGDE